MCGCRAGGDVPAQRDRDWTNANANAVLPRIYPVSATTSEAYERISRCDS